jgi:hypothetical protein
MYDLNINVDGCATVDEVRGRLQSAAEALPKDALVRVARASLTGQVAGPLQLASADLVSVPHGLDKVVIQRLDIRTADDTERIAAESTVRGAFVRMVHEAAGLDAQDRQLVLTAGLRAFSGRGDLQVV